MCKYCGNHIERKLISVKVFSNLYNVSPEAQKSLRKRLKHPLPYIQFTKKGNIYYEISTVDKWIENYIKV